MRGEPASVPEIPHPSCFEEFRLEFRETAEWFDCGPPVNATQGWKLYVPLTLANASEVIRRLVPLAHREKLHFKYIRSIKKLRKLNAGTFGYPQVGKCFVIYLPKPDAAVIAALKETLAPYRDQCPAVPCAQPLGNRLPLYYRYGAYRGNRLEVGGTRVEDCRADLPSAVPAGIADELVSFTSPDPEDPVVRSFLSRYPLFEALVQQGKCGVFHGMDLESETFREVVLKVGYHRGQVQPDGSDGNSFLRRELAFYRELARRGLSDLAPEMIDALDVPRKVILVLEYIPGTSLLVRKMAGQLTVEHLERCWQMLNRLHAAGLYLQDAKLANFLFTDDSDLRLLDFEAAGIIGEKSPTIGTFFVDPSPSDPVMADRAHFLASVLYPYEEQRYSWRDRHVKLASWLEQGTTEETGAWALQKLRELINMFHAKDLN